MFRKQDPRVKILSTIDLRKFDINIVFAEFYCLPLEERVVTA